MENNWWLARATCFCVGQYNGYDVQIIERKQPNDAYFPTKWIVQIGDDVLGKDNQLHWQRTASDRTSGFLDKTRFETKEQAYQQYQKFIS